VGLAIVAGADKSSVMVVGRYIPRTRIRTESDVFDRRFNAKMAGLSFSAFAQRTGIVCTAKHDVDGTYGK